MGYEIDFLPVGEGEKSGDAIALRFGNLHGSRQEQTIVVVDGGFQASGEALVKHIKQYYDTSRVDLVVSTHPDDDHASGLEVVLNELAVGELWMHRPWNHTDDIARMLQDGRVTDNSVREALRRALEEARTLERLALAKGIPITEPFEGLQDKTGCITVLGPSEDYYESLLPDFRCTPETKAGSAGLLEWAINAGTQVLQRVLETWDIETLDDSGETTAENNSSAILHIAPMPDRHLLLTADAGIPALTYAADYLDLCAYNYGLLSFIQAPHHGSKRNVGPTILNRIVGPKLKQDTRKMTAFVSASKDGAPKHPAKKVTNAFRRRGAPVCATNGEGICHFYDAPGRGWHPITPIPFYNEVDE